MQVLAQKISPPIANVLAGEEKGGYIDRCNYFLVRGFANFAQSLQVPRTCLWLCVTLCLAGFGGATLTVLVVVVVITLVPLGLIVSVVVVTVVVAGGRTDFRSIRGFALLTGFVKGFAMQVACSNNCDCYQAKYILHHNCIHFKFVVIRIISDFCCKDTAKKGIFKGSFPNPTGIFP